MDVVEFGDGGRCVCPQEAGVVRQLYSQVPQTDWVSSSSSCGQDARVRTGSRRRAWALSDPRLSSPAKMRKKCCYGQKNFGSICSNLSPSPTHLSHTANITLSRIKSERYIFIKKCVRSFVHWSPSLLLTMFPLIFVHVLCTLSSSLLLFISPKNSLWIVQQDT